MDCSLPHSSVDGIFQAGILSRLPFPPPRHLSNSGNQLMCFQPVFLVSPAQTGFFTTEPPGKPMSKVERDKLMENIKKQEEMYRKC